MLYKNKCLKTDFPWVHFPLLNLHSLLFSFSSSISLPLVSLHESVRVSIPHSSLSVFHNTSCKASRFNAFCSITEGPVSLLLIQQTLQTNISPAIPQRPISAHIQKRSRTTHAHTYGQTKLGITPLDIIEKHSARYLPAERHAGSF